ncbi:unnamed protein product [Urochloa humidicola]
MLAHLAAAAGRRAARPLSLAIATATSPRPGLGSSLAPVSPFLSTVARRFSSTPPPDDLTPAELALYRLIVEHEAAHEKQVELLRRENQRLFDVMAKSAMEMRAAASAAGQNGARTVALSAMMVACLALIYMSVKSAKRAALTNKEATRLDNAAQDLLNSATSLEKAAQDLLDAVEKAVMPGERKVPTAETIKGAQG